MPGDLRVVVRVDVDEPRREDEPVEVDDLRTVGGTDIADGDDAVTLDGDIDRAGRRAGAVDDLPASKNEVHRFPLQLGQPGTTVSPGRASLVAAECR